LRDDVLLLPSLAESASCAPVATHARASFLLFSCQAHDDSAPRSCEQVTAEAPLMPDVSPRPVWVAPLFPQSVQITKTCSKALLTPDPPDKDNFALRSEPCRPDWTSHKASRARPRKRKRARARAQDARPKLTQRPCPCHGNDNRHSHHLLATNPPKRYPMCTSQ
jgi:hypothetical protein